MENRKYNIFFDLHTVSGIVISVGLYIIFFAGGFTLFYEAIEKWEKKENTNAPVTTTVKNIDFNKALSALEKKGYALYGRSISFYGKDYKNISVYLSGTSDTTASEKVKKEEELSLNASNYTISKRGEEGTRYSLGSLLYDLHFYYQLGDFGYYLSGVVALFFLFALVTGVLVHWKKLISNFYLFRPREKLKTVWTDAHTALGTIGIPFQFIYALTGAMFGLGILVSLSGSVLYGGSQEKYYKEVYGDHADSLGIRTNVSHINLNALADSAKNRWTGFEPNYYQFTKYGSTTMQFNIYGTAKNTGNILNDGEVVYNVFTGAVTHEHSPVDKPYSESVGIVYRLHFASYGDIGILENYLLKTFYFLMTITTCFVIISGVLIWLEARNKKNIDEKIRRYNQRVGYIYLSICLGMLPVTAFSFIVSKLLPESVAEHSEIILNSVFFGSWLLVSIYLYFLKNNYLINKYTLLSGGILGLCIPVISGVVSGNWIWVTALAKPEIFALDLLWLILSAVSLYAILKITKPKEKLKV